MSRLEKRFASLQAAGKKALIPYICAGDPSLESTVPLLHELVRSGASAIELGMPFSDPMADGPVIHRARDQPRFQSRLRVRLREGIPEDGQ